MLSRCLLRGAGKHGTDVGSPLPHTWGRFEDTSSSICPAPPPLPSDRVASVGWKPQSGNLAKGRWGTPSSAALLRVGWFLFLSWPVRCGAVGRVQGPPVLEGPGRRSCGPTRVRVRKTEALLVRQGLVCLEDGSRLRLCKQVIVQTHPHV